MKILICTDALGYGGAETHVLALAGELDAMGHSVTVAAPHGELERELPASVTFFPLPAFHGSPRTAPRLPGPLGLIRLLRVRRRLASLARRGFDVMHAHARLPALLLCGIARRRRIPLVVTAHAMFRMTPLRRRLSRWGDRTIAVSEDIKQLLVSRGGVWADNVTVIPNGIDTVRFSPATTESEEFGMAEVACADEVGVTGVMPDAGVWTETGVTGESEIQPEMRSAARDYLGAGAEIYEESGETEAAEEFGKSAKTEEFKESDEYAKNEGAGESGNSEDPASSSPSPHIIFVSRLDHDCSSAAAALCRLAGRLRGEFPGLTVTIVGGGDRYGELSTLAELMNTACGDEVVRLTGARSDVGILLRRADIFVGVSRAAMEAAACGLPVILAGDEGYGGIFSPGDAVDPTNRCARGSAGSLAESLFGDICRLARLPADERRRLGQAGREFIIRHHSAAASAERTVAVYREAAALFAKGQPRAVICGGAGFGNPGLDAAADVLIRRLRSKGLKPAEICLIVPSPRRAQVRFGVRCIGRRNGAAIQRALLSSRLLLLGGGSLIHSGAGIAMRTSGRAPWQVFGRAFERAFERISGRAPGPGGLRNYRRLAARAQRLGCGVMIWGAGLGPLYGETARRQAALLLGGAGLILLREPLALDIAHSLGLRLDGGSVYADPALLTEPCGRERAAMLLGDGNYFAVSLRPPRRGEGVGTSVRGLGLGLGLGSGLGSGVGLGFAVRGSAREEEHRRIRLAAALDGISQVCGAEAVFFIMSPDDRDFTESVRRHMERPGRVLDGLTPGETVALLGRCRVTVSMRLHLLEFSFAAGVPAVGIGNTPDILGFMSYASLPAPLPATLSAPAQLVSLAASAAMRPRVDVARREELLALADAGVERVAYCICRCED